MTLNSTLGSRQALTVIVIHWAAALLLLNTRV